MVRPFAIRGGPFQPSLGCIAFRDAFDSEGFGQVATRRSNENDNETTRLLPEPFTSPVALRSRDDVISLADLWLRCFALGSTNTLQELAGFLSGELRPTRHEYNLVAVALNEYFVEIGAAQSVPYIEHAELADMTAAVCPRWRRSIDPARW
jgi:hypothetical protein